MLTQCFGSSLLKTTVAERKQSAAAPLRNQHPSPTDCHQKKGGLYNKAIRIIMHERICDGTISLSQDARYTTLYERDS